MTANAITLGNYIIQYNEADDTLDFIYTGTITSDDVITPTWQIGNIYQDGSDNDNDSTALRTTNIEYDSAYNYTITLTSEFEGIENIKVYFYASDGTFISRKTSASLGITTVGTSTTITFPSNTASFRIKVDIMTGNSVSNMNNRLIIRKVAK